MEAVLASTGIVHGYMSYPLATRSVSEFRRLRSRIVEWGPDLLVYLAAPRGVLKEVRDIAFFLFCGIRTIRGAPLVGDLRAHRRLASKRGYESEGSRLARCVGALGDSRLDDPASWSLALTVDELARADQLLGRFGSRPRFLTASIGAKANAKDWGPANWQALIARLTKTDPQLGLVTVGGADDVGISDQVLMGWRGPTLNTCGQLTPRESAAVISKSLGFVGHDGGPMHLAAAVGVRCVAIFSARDKPGVWFPYGSRHRVIYHQTDCFNCHLDVCKLQKKRCILSITVEEVLTAVLDMIENRGPTNKSIAHAG